MNIEKKKEYMKEYNRTHRDQHRVYRKEYYQTHKNQINDHDKEHYRLNREHILTQVKRYYQTHKEQHLAHSKKYAEVHRYQINLRIKNNIHLLHLQVIDRLGNKCANPYDIDHGDFLVDSRCLQIDHINGGGNKERMIWGNVHVFLRHLSKLPDSELKSKYQLLCANCNWIKGDANNEFSKK